MPGAVTTSVAYRAYAKINLYLQVLERRSDGFHNIETVFQTVGLADELRFRLQEGRITLKCNVADLDGEDNLALQAAALLQRECAPDQGVHIDLEKRIPVAAGLAGGSGDAAATIVALNDLWDLGLSPEQMRAYALRLGSDVPYLTVGGTVAATGRGEVLTLLQPMRESWFVFLHPPIEVSAARVYNHPNLPKSDERRLDSMTASFKMALAMLAKGAIADLLHNAMEIPVFSEYPELAVTKQRLLDAGCAAALMSGSGPTLFGLCKNEEHAHAVAAHFTGVPTSVVPTVPSGVERLT